MNQEAPYITSYLKSDFFADFFFILHLIHWSLKNFNFIIFKHIWYWQFEKSCEILFRPMQQDLIDDKSTLTDIQNLTGLPAKKINRTNEIKSCV